jgi:hypothetical protein
MVAPSAMGFGAAPAVEDARVTALKRKLDTLQYRDAFDTTSLPLVEKVRSRAGGELALPPRLGSGGHAPPAMGSSRGHCTTISRGG